MPEAQERSVLLYWQTLRTLVAELEPRRPLHAALKSTLHVLAEAFSFERPHLILFDTESHTLRLSLADSPPKTLSAEYSPGVGVTGQVFATGKPVIVECMKEDALFQNRLFQRSDEELRRYAFLSVPVLASDDGGALHGEVLGTLNVDSPIRERAVLEQDCAFLEVVAALIANHAAYLQEEIAREKYRAHWPSAQNRLQESMNPIALSRAMRLCRSQAEKLARGRGSIFLYGEHATGKEALAHSIHNASSRRAMPFLYCDCAQHNVDRILFGTHKGFAGERQSTKGLLEQAHTGTIFLHHVDALSASDQAKIEVLLYEQEIHRLGHDAPIPVDVRLILSSSGKGKDAQAYHERIPVLHVALRDRSVYVPSLRERKDDILALSDALLRDYALNLGTESPRISRPAADMLLEYDWPGNLAELTYCLQQAVNRCEEGLVRSYHLPLFLPSNVGNSAVPFTEAVARFEKEFLHDALDQAKGNMLQAARSLGTSYRIVNYKVKKYGLK